MLPREYRGEKVAYFFFPFVLFSANGARMDAHLTKLDLLRRQTCPGSPNLTLLLQIHSVQKVSPHPELHAKYLKTKKWQWSSRWLYWRKGTPSQFYIWHMKESLYRTVLRKWSWDKTEKQLLSPSAGQKDWMWPTEKGVFYNSLLCQWLFPGAHLLNLWHCKEADLQASENLTVIFFLVMSTFKIYSFDIFFLLISLLWPLGGGCWSPAFSARLQLCWMGSVLRWRLLRRGTSSKAGVLPRLRQAGSVTAAHGLAAPQHVCSSAVPGIKPPSPALPGAFLTRRPPGTPSLGTF